MEMLFSIPVNRLNLRDYLTVGDKLVHSAHITLWFIRLTSCLTNTKYNVTVCLIKKTSHITVPKSLFTNK